MPRFLPWFLCVVILLAKVIPCQAEYTLTWEGHPAHYQMPSPPFNSLGDFDGDGRVELVSFDSNSVIRVRDALTGALECELIGPAWLGYESPSTSTMDLDMDGTPELIFSTAGVQQYQAGFAVLDFVGPTGSVFGGMPTATPAGSIVHPNPFNPSATIDYAVPHTGNVTLAVYDATGRLVRTLVDAKLESGNQSVAWDGRDGSGQVLPSGTYFYSLNLDGQVLDKGKAVILK